MKSIVLASSSPQRQNLMKITGLPFKVIPSKADELTTIKTTVDHLVKHNARLKAEDVARLQKNALVIGCDTVVYSARKRLILKPRDLKEAKKNLLELMEKPHWVYSGLCVLDSSTGKQYVCVEKTKVFMHKLTSKEIDRYHQLVNPLDKAGGFDIEGKGALFIHRIEGCYFNVVGLPLAALARLLAMCGVKVLS